MVKIEQVFWIIRFKNAIVVFMSRYMQGDKETGPETGPTLIEMVYKSS